jgi:hypothetical protein
MNYGLPYKGSKAKIADRILDLMPSAGTFYDLFAGGMAVTHAAMLRNKFGKVVCNDINGEMMNLFVEAVNGRFKGENRWISRKDFFLLKDSDPYVKYVWSFGNNGETYMYSKEIEPIKKAVWDICFAPTPYERKMAFRGLSKDFEETENEKMRLRGVVIDMCDECGVECKRREDGTPDVEYLYKELKKAKSNHIRTYMRNALEKSGLKQSDVDRHLGTQMSGHYFGASQWALPTAEHYKKIQEIIPDLTEDWGTLNESLQSLQSLESLESLERLQRLQSLERLERLESFVGDYRDVDICADSVVYCDIPYINTDSYGMEFDHEAFYDWVCGLNVPVFISEYWMPEDRFDCVAEFKKAKTFGAKNTSVIEKVFCPKNNNRAMKMGKLF